MLIAQHVKFYHSAIWHEDLIELKRRGFIEGIIEKSDYEIELIRFEQLKKDLGDNLKEDDNGNIIFYIKEDDGKFRETKYNKPEAYKEDNFFFRNYAVITEFISLSKAGIDELIKISHEINLREDLAHLTEPLIKIGRFDTAIRDASLLLESTIKQFHNKDSLFGQRLVEFHLDEIIKKNNNFNSAAIKCYRGELRTIFNFIRNDFAHNFKVLTEEQCKVILSRINDALFEFDEVVNTYFK